MDESSRFESVPIMGTRQFSWVFIVDWILVLVVTLFVIFFFNRLLGTIISAAFRWWIWRWYRIRIKVQSVQLSLLGGRVFFKNMSYVGTNEIITAVQGNFTWRYWLLKRRMSRLDAEQEGDVKHADENIPARLAMKVDGLEWFVFNRSAVYDNLFDYVVNQTTGENSGSTTTYRSESHEDDEKDEKGPGLNIGVLENMFLRLMPFQIKFGKSALVVGNKTTPSLLVLHMVSGKGYADVASSKNPLDKYKMVYHVNAVKPVLEMRANPTYEGLRKDMGLTTTPKSRDKSKHVRGLFGRVTMGTLEALNALLFRNFRTSGDGDDDETWEKQQWKGLTRYLSHEADERFKDDNITEGLNDLVEEYGRYSTLIDAVEGSLTYYYDIAGKVPQRPEPTLEEDGQDIGNGGSAPEFGMNITLSETTVHYGPWADRQRIPLQSMLFPRCCADATPTARLQPGQDRQWTQMKLLVEFNGDSIIRVPLREFSKNEEFFAMYKDNPNANSIRPFGWIEVKLQESSTISFDASLTTTAEGSWNTLRVDFKSPEMRSSVNHGLLFSADRHQICGKTHYPLKWNGLQSWYFNNTSTNVQTFFLREHVTLLTDLVKDFGAGPQTHYDLFTPTKYHLHWKLEGFAIYLNVNGLNIINNPADFDDNTLISFRGEQLLVGVEIPLEQIETTRNQVDFTIEAPQFDLGVEAPPWHTMRSFLESNVVGRAYDFILKGSYSYFTKITQGKADTLVMNIDGSNVTFIAHGFILKYLMQIRENYFGESAHFQTLEEYSENPKPKSVKYVRHKNDNDLDALLYIFVHEGCIVLPANLYSAQSNVRLDFASFDADLRFTNYYMDLQTNISPIQGRYNQAMDPKIITDLAKHHRDFDPELFIDGLSAHGHRLFGLPPTEPTYLCKWDFDIGGVLINGPFTTVQGLSNAIKCAGYSFVDAENSLLLPDPELYDVTYLSLKVASVKVQLHTDSCTLEIVTSNVDVTMNDLANERYSKRLTVRVPLGRLALLGITKQENSDPPVLAAFKTSILITNFVQKRGFDHFYRSQQDHIALHDDAFGRCPFLLDSEHRQKDNSVEGPDDLQPSITMPDIPPPLTKDTLEIVDPNGVSGIGNVGSLSESSIATSHTHYSKSVGNNDNLIGGLSSAPFTEPTTLNPVRSETEESNDEVDTPNRFLPPQKWQTFEKLGHEFRSTNVDFQLHPTVHYAREEPIAPSSGIDQNVEYDNVVVQLGPLEGYVGPKALGAAHSVIDTAQHYHSTEDTLDSLQIGVLKQIRYINYGKPDTLNLRLLIPEVNVKYGSVEESVEIHSLVENEQSHIYLDCKEINVAVRLSDRKQPQSIGEYMEHQTQEEVRKIMYFDVENVDIGVRRGKQDVDEHATTQRDYYPMVLRIGSMEFWYHEDDTNVGSLRINTIDSTIDTTSAQWLAGYLSQTVRQAQELNASQDHSIVKGQDRAAFVVYELATAGERYGIQHDPSVLTKPAYIIRSPQHVRASTSWKILVRLRHLFQTVPRGWCKELNHKVAQNEWSFPSDIKSRVVEVFMRWRSWELSNIPESYFFKHAFIEKSLKETLMSVSTDTLLDVESIGLRLQYADDEDFLMFDYTRFLLSWDNSLQVEDLDENEPSLNVDMSLACSSVRTKVGYEVLPVYRLVEGYIPKKEAPPATTKAPPDFSMLPVLNVNCTVVVSSTSTTFSLPSLVLQIDSREFKASGMFKHLSANKEVGVSLVSDMEFFKIALLTAEDDQVFAHSVKGIVSSINFFGPLQSCAKYCLFSIDDAQFSLNYDLSMLIDLTGKVIDNDVEWLLQHIGSSSASASPSSSSPSSSSSSSSFSKPVTAKQHTTTPGYFGPVLVTFEQKAGSADFYIMRSTVLRYQIGNLRADLRQMDAEICCAQLQIQSQEVEIRSGVDDTLLLNAELAHLETLVRLEFAQSIDGLTIAELMANIGEIKLVSDSVVTSAKHLMYHEFHSEVRRLCKKAETLTSQATTLANRLKTEASEVKKKKDDNEVKSDFALNVNFAVTRALIVGTLGDDSMVLDGEELALKFQMFEQDGESGSIYKCPLSGDLSSRVNKVVLVGDRGMGKNNTLDIVSIHASAVFQERKSKDDKDRINFNSDFIHVKLNPSATKTLFKLFTAIKQELVVPIKSKKPQMSKPMSSSSTSTTSSSTSPIKYAELIKRFADRSIAALRLTNVAIAWLYDEEQPDAGILLGYEVFEISTTSFKARTVLNGTYITPARRESVFLANGESVDDGGHVSANTAYLPNVELMVLYELSSPHPTLNLKLVGESLKFTLLPSIVEIVAQSSDSIMRTATALEQFKGVEPDDEQQEVQEAATTSVDRLRLPFNVHLVVQFEAANINVWDESEFNRYQHLYKIGAVGDNNTNPADSEGNVLRPALQLQSPSIRMELGYELCQEQGERDRVNMHLLISSSSNTVYPRAVPVTIEVYDSVKRSMQKSHEAKRQWQRQAAQATRRHSSATVQPSTQATTNLFNGLDVYIGVQFLRQEITLSCLPTAKVAATLSHDQCVFTINTCDSVDNNKSGRRYFCGTARLQKLSASLQHIYSREVAGYVALDDLVLFVSKNNDEKSTVYDAVMVNGQLSDVNIDINLRQMQDLELFLDIWRPSSMLSGPSKQGQETEHVEFGDDDSNDNDDGEEDDGHEDSNDDNIVLKKYRRATTTTVAIPWAIDVSIVNVSGAVDMGQSIGKVTMVMDRTWLSSQKSSNWEQNMMLGFDHVEVSSEGRLGGLVKLTKLQMKTAILWNNDDSNDAENVEFGVPLVQALVGLRTFEAKLSLDFHLFSVVYVKALRLSMSNQHDAERILGDRLMVVGDCDILNVYLTGLAASNVLDIYYTVVRIRKESHASYDAILNDSATGPANNRQSKRAESRQRGSKLSAMVASLRTVLDMRISTCNLHIFPNSMTDNVVFMVAVDGINATYSHEYEPHGDDGSGQLSSKLDMHMEEFTVALASMRKSLSQKDVTQVVVPAFVTHTAESARGGTIIHVPAFDISMSTWQEFNTSSGAFSSVVEYVFHSSFNGRVDVGWNLGSVNFIREMWQNHARAYTTRREAYALRTSASSASPSTPTTKDSSGSMLGNVNLDENIRDVELNSAYSYVPREPPVIATPQLRDMGEATPPIEWIGLHRQRFPGLTHQVVILPLQSMVKEVEVLYRNVLGHS